MPQVCIGRNAAGRLRLAKTVTTPLSEGTALPGNAPGCPAVVGSVCEFFHHSFAAWASRVAAVVCLFAFVKCHAGLGLIYPAVHGILPGPKSYSAPLV